jgi:hypothetical protein
VTAAYFIRKNGDYIITVDNVLHYYNFGESTHALTKHLDADDAESIENVVKISYPDALVTCIACVSAGYQALLNKGIIKEW